jgi:hypothetical protein
MGGVKGCSGFSLFMATETEKNYILCIFGPFRLRRRCRNTQKSLKKTNPFRVVLSCLRLLQAVFSPNSDLEPTMTPLRCQFRCHIVYCKALRREERGQDKDLLARHPRRHPEPANLGQGSRRVS